MDLKEIRRDSKIGLALGGGAVLGAAHIGVLKALDDYDIKPACIAGTSIGSFVGALYAFGKCSEEVEKIGLDLKWLDISGLSLSHFGLLSNKKMAKLLNENISEALFDQASIPFSVIATDISNGEKATLSTGSVASAVMASTCIPGIFKPVEIGGRLLVDGGIVENVPVSPLKDMGAEIIIGVDLISGLSHKRPHNIIEVLLNSFMFALQTASKIQTEAADILIKPDLSAFNMVDTDQAPKLIEEGYDEAISVLNEYVII